MHPVMKYVKATIAFLLFGVIGTVIGYAYWLFFKELYPTGLTIESWWTVGALLFFSALIIFLLNMIVDLIEILCRPIRRFGGPYRIVGISAIVAYIFFGALSLYNLWAVCYHFNLSNVTGKEGVRLAMAILMTISTIVVYGLSITSAWGPKDMGGRQVS